LLAPDRTTFGFNAARVGHVAHQSKSKDRDTSGSPIERFSVLHVVANPGSNAPRGR
jgi:hypothetical protein